jgi:hypothetical protein
MDGNQTAINQNRRILEGLDDVEVDEDTGFDYAPRNHKSLGNLNAAGQFPRQGRHGFEGSLPGKPSKMSKSCTGFFQRIQEKPMNIIIENGKKRKSSSKVLEDDFFITKVQSYQ